MHWITITFMFSCLTTFAFAKEELNFLNGLWQGEGLYTAVGRDSKFKSTECVYQKLGGAITIIEGQHFGTNETLVHNAYAVLSKVDGENYRFSSYLSDGRSGDFHATVGKNLLQWSMKTDKEDIRFSATISDDTWSEVGEISKDGGDTWAKFFSMDLKRTSKECIGLKDKK